MPSSMSKQFRKRATVRKHILGRWIACKEPHQSCPVHRLWPTTGFVLVMFILLLAYAPAVSAQTPSPTPTLDAGGTQPNAPQPHQETLEARVLSAAPPAPCAADATGQVPVDPLTGKPQLCQKVQVQVTKGSTKGEIIDIDEGTIPVASKANVIYHQGDTVLVDWEYSEDQPSTYNITDFVRTDGLWVLAALFVILAVAFGRLRGLSSLVGLVISFLVLIFFIVPRIAGGGDPVGISIAGALVIMLVTMYLSHGFNLKTTAAICGTSISLVLTGLLAWFSLDLVKLTGFGSEEAVYVQIAQSGSVNVRGLLLGGIIIGALGVLNDITIGQSSAVFEFHAHDPTMSAQKLFFRVSNIGRDHIAATVNTLVLAYAGASLPLLILFVAGNDPWSSVINSEIVAQEVVRALVGSIGLIASVPVTTWIASLIAVRTHSEPVDGEPVVSAHTHTRG